MVSPWFFEWWWWWWWWWNPGEMGGRAERRVKEDFPFTRVKTTLRKKKKKRWNKKKRIRRSREANEKVTRHLISGRENHNNKEGKLPSVLGVGVVVLLVGLMGRFSW